MKSVNLKPLKDFTVKACKVVGSGLALALSHVVSEMVRNNCNPNSVTYNDAVEAIMDSYMASSYKREAVAALKRVESEDYYKAVIAVTNSWMAGSEQVETIRQMSGEN